MENGKQKVFFISSSSLKFLPPTRLHAWNILKN